MTLALHLVRHGQTSWNAVRRLQGNHDVELSEAGVAQARALAPVLARVLAPHERSGRGVTVVTSPLSRARASCALLGLVPDRVDDRWAEADLGTWTGRTQAELMAVGDGAFAAWRDGTLSPPRAETLNALRRRVGHAITDLGPHQVAVVVTHGGPIRAACHALVGLGTGSLVPVGPGSLTSFDLAGPRPRLLAYNLTPDVGAGPPQGPTTD